MKMAYIKIRLYRFHRFFALYNKPKYNFWLFKENYTLYFIFKYVVVLYLMICNITLNKTKIKRVLIKVSYACNVMHIYVPFVRHNRQLTHSNFSSNSVQNELGCFIVKGLSFLNHTMSRNYYFLLKY